MPFADVGERKLSFLVRGLSCEHFNEVVFRVGVQVEWPLYWSALDCSPLIFASFDCRHSLLREDIPRAFGDVWPWDLACLC